jgi:hypothetical protein
MRNVVKCSFPDVLVIVSTLKVIFEGFKVCMLISVGTALKNMENQKGIIARFVIGRRFTFHLFPLSLMLYCSMPNLL